MSLKDWVVRIEGHGRLIGKNRANILLLCQCSIHNTLTVSTNLHMNILIIMICTEQLRINSTYTRGFGWTRKAFIDGIFRDDTLTDQTLEWALVVQIGRTGTVRLVKVYFMHISALSQGITVRPNALAIVADLMEWKSTLIPVPYLKNTPNLHHTNLADKEILHSAHHATMYCCPPHTWAYSSCWNRWHLHWEWF